MAEFFHCRVKITDRKGFAGLDYAGGGVVAPLEELLKFMQALVTHRIVTRETLESMKHDKAKFGLGIDYGYGIWQLPTIPLLVPKKFNCWGVAGATGAFLFYHPVLDAYLVGTFNDTAYMRKGIMFMLKVIGKLFK